MSESDSRPQCFVAMWFGSSKETSDEMNQLYDIVIKPAVEQHKLKSYRVDQDPGADKLDETILTEIDKSDLAIADLTHDPETGLRGSVIFEAGYAYREKPVIWMCREDVANNTPFDIRQFKQIRWSPNKLLDARRSLIDVIRTRFRERVKQSDTHEIKRLITDMWRNIESAQDITPPSGEGTITADQIRFLQFQEFCDDLDTRVKYKDMGLTNSEKYELIEMIRGFRKVVIDLPQSRNRIASMDVYENIVASKLRASGWF